MPRRAIVTVGVSDGRIFGPYLERFERTFREYGGADYFKMWHREWPTGSPTHRNINYAFKLYAVQDAMDHGCTSVLWFDASCWAIRPLGSMWQHLERDGHLLIRDVNTLATWASDHSLAQFNVTRDEAEGIYLMCGTGYGLDLTNDRSRTFLERMRSHAIPGNFNGTHKSRHPGLAIEHPRPDTSGALYSDDPRCYGHRSDEVYMSLIARDLGMETHIGEEFAGGSTVWEKSCVRSGYTLPLNAGPDTYNERDPKLARSLHVIAEHTIDTALLTPAGLVLDAGCRNFNFARGLVDRGCRVIALDPDPTVTDPGIEGVAFFSLALAHEPGERELVITHDPQARYLAPVGATVQEERRTVQATTLLGLMDTLGIARWDAVKLDIEGSEYDILLNWPGPVATQISVEFHEHCAPRPQSVYDAIFAHLGQWYDVVQHAKERQHGCPENFWDTLMILR